MQFSAEARPMLCGWCAPPPWCISKPSTVFLMGFFYLSAGPWHAPLIEALFRRPGSDHAWDETQRFLRWATPLSSREEILLLLCTALVQIEVRRLLVTT
jgi:hypothetical protein